MKQYTVFDELYQLARQNKLNFRNLDTVDPLVIKDGQIVLFTQVGDFCFYERDYAAMYESALEYYQCTGKYNNYFIVLTTQNIPQGFAQRFKDIATFYRIPTFYAWYHNKIGAKKYKREQNIQKIFLCLNNRATWYRQLLFYVFKQYNLLNKSYFSYIMENRFNEEDLFEYIHAQVGTTYNRIGSSIDISEIKSMIPYRVEFDSNINGHGDWGLTNNRFYNETFCSIVTESYHEEGDPFFTEKVFKPIASYHPFLLFASNQSLTYLRELGFETFSSVFNETYDTIPNTSLRFEALINEILRISKWTIEDCNHAVNLIEPILEHNANHFLNRLPEMYKKDIARVKLDISNLLQTITPLVR